MLPRSERLRRAEDIDAVVKKGKKYSHEALSWWITQKPKGPFRATVLCSKKVDRRATARNTIKRRVREVLRTLVRPKFPHIDIVVSARAGVKNLAVAEIRNIFRNVLHIS